MKIQNLRYEILAPAGQILAESANWCSRDKSLWWVDIRAHQVKRWSSSTDKIDIWILPEVCAAVIPTSGEEVVVALREGLHLLDPNTGAVINLLKLESDLPENRLNEAKCDRQGRLWCGSMWDFGKHPTGSLYRIDSDLEVSIVRRGLTIPNGLAFSPNGREMFFVDSITGCIECADYDTHTGLPGPWRNLVQEGALQGLPDGGTVDADGCIWSTRYGAGCIARYTPKGKLDRLINLPVSQPTSCTFGGENLDTLFITSASQRMSSQALLAEPLAGAVIALRPGVQGLPEPTFILKKKTLKH